MWPFRDRSTAKLEAEIDDLRSEVKRLRLEWDETYDKIAHQFERDRKRRKTALGMGEGEIGAGNGILEAVSPNLNDPIAIFQLARQKGI